MAIQIPIDVTADTGDLSKVTDGLEDISSALDDVDTSAGDAKSSLKDVGDASGDVDPKNIEDMSDALKDVDEKAGDADDSLKDVDDAAKKAGDAGKDLDRDLTTALDNVRDASKTAGDDLGKNIKDGTGRAEEGLNEFKDEANSTARESAASFDGSADSIADAFQEVAANAFAGFGPAGAAAGILVAVGLGTAMSKLQEMADKVNEAKEEMGALGIEIAETGQGLAGVDLVANVRSWAAEITNARSSWEFWQDEAVNNLDEVSEAAGKAGEDLSGFWAAMVSDDTTTSLAYLEELKQKQADIDKQRDDLINGSQTLTEAQFKEAEALKLQSEGYDDLIPSIEEAVNKKVEAEDFAVKVRAAEQGVTEEYIRQQDAIAANNAEIESNNELKNESIDIAGEAFLSEGEYAAAVRDATDAIATNGATTDANTEAGQKNREALVNAAGASREYASAQAGAGATQETVNGILQRGRTDFINMATAAGMGSDEANALADSLGLVPNSVQTDIKTTGAAQAQTDAQGVTTKVGDIPTSKDINIKVNTTGMQSAVDDAARQIIPPTVTVNARLGKAVAV